jgi:acetyltransferase-like isoleucine patch superfamily enzyme
MLSKTKDGLVGPRFSIGEYTYGMPTIVGKYGNIQIGKFCSISENVQLMMVGHPTNWITTYPFSSRYCRGEWGGAAQPGSTKVLGDIRIGNDVWIGRGAMIFAGVAVGSGSIIGAGAVVRIPINPYAIVLGDPAVEVRKRFALLDIDLLLKIAWWDWPKEKIQLAIPDLCNSNVDVFIQKYRGDL